MQYFLQQVAKDVYTRNKDSLGNIAVIFPNRRAGLFFRKYLSANLEKPFWSPHLYTISDLMQQFSGLHLADPIMLIFDMHQIFNREKAHPEPFDEFYFWGEILLGDFEDIDKYLVNPKDLFTNLASIKSIEDQFTYLTEEQIHAIRRFWDTFKVRNLSDEQRDFLSIWDILYKVYLSFNKLLDKKNYAYEGKIYRKVSELVKAGQLDEPHTKYIFVGFNALSPCEKRLFNYLKNQGKAEFYWDYDEYYLKNHEAGKFIRENLRDFPNMLDDVPSKMDTGKKIRFLNTAYDIAQAKILPELLKDSKIPSDKPNNTAIVLSDEHLLQPVLNSIPDNVEAINVTMGYPVSVTPAYSLLLSMIQLQKNARTNTGKGEQQDKKAVSFYYKDVLSILNHQYIGLVRSKKTDELLGQIKKHNKVYVDAEELRLTEFMHKLFVYPGDYKSLSDYLMENYYHFYRILKEKGSEEISVNLELECIYYVYLMVKKLKDIFKERYVEVTTETYLRILEKTIQNQKIPYEGEPLSGMQVMGILETRTLDFDNLILLSMNEGVFPKADATPSFVPYNLRKGFGLPTYEYHDAIYAYYFYRMLQRANDVTLVYNSGSAGIQTGEMSRFMHQLKYESDFEIKESTVISSVSTPDIREIRVAKSSDVLQKLEEYNSLTENSKTLSPSALNKFLACPLQFYFRYIAGLKEPEQIDENVDLPLFGSLLHKALEMLYEDYKGKEVTQKELKKLEKDNAHIENILKESFRQEYFTGFTSAEKINLSGKNILIKEILQKYIHQFLRTDQKFAPFTIHSLEKAYAANVDFKVSGESKMVTFSGIIDRVDINKDGIRILDYKTGKSEQNFKNVAHLFELGGNHKALQSLLYSMMYDATEHPGQEIVPGLYFIRDLFNNNFDYALKSAKKKIKYHEVVDELMEHLQIALQNLFNPEQDFYQTEDKNICRNCPYAEICRR
ncbi:MAG: PD-(D/E)XK nuclease family protein [Bacteroidales bacterium]